MALLSNSGSPKTENHSVDECSRGSRKPVMAGQQSHAGCKSNFDDTAAREKRSPHETKPEKRERKAIEKQDARDKKEQARSEAKLKQEGARQALHEARCEQSRGKVEPESNYSRHQEALPLSRKEIDHVSRRYTNHQPFHTSGAKNAGERRSTALQANSHHSRAPLARENSINHHNSRVSQQKELNELMNEGLGEWSLERSHSNYNCGLSSEAETDIETDIETDTLWESKVAEECEDYRSSQSLADTTEREFLAEFEKHLSELESSNDWHDSQEFQSEADLICEGSSDISEVDVSEKEDGAFSFLDIYAMCDF
ncbi:hypothetical protein [Endozoicomonas sp.]|uniref:hypothetical protein n=1 Tax=Endozoicomonas sp. TaxID=1892382 RepID=UPI003AF8A78B